jgi:hypothetical protein
MTTMTTMTTMSPKSGPLARSVDEQLLARLRRSVEP